MPLPLGEGVSSFLKTCSERGGCNKNFLLLLEEF